MTDLALPAADLFDTWADCVREFGDDRRDGSGDWQIEHFGADRATFDALLEICRTEADPTSTLPEGHVHCDYYWIVEGGEDADDPTERGLIGFMAVRHSIDTEFLRTLGGHIGYSIRPSRRRRGHASRALGLALDRAREVGLDRVLITCDPDNVGSARVIEGQGGVLDIAPSDNCRYWITL
ncbi:MAG: GNAT family N-acetyltransferase [Humibacillus sp.]|nr:GNAT family N-acetyltransferase [Humibacillus sp.]MDN5775459.1 GNAT family N-acetyltransferase [Humibacillus sp.]